MSFLAERDLRAMVAVIEDGRADEPGPGMPWALMDSLLALIPCDELGFVENDLVRQIRSVGESVYSSGGRYFQLGRDYPPGTHSDFWRLHMGFPGCGFAAGFGDPHRWSDLMTSRELHNQPLFAEVFGPMGAKQAMTLDLPARPGYTRRLLFWRHTSGDFSERDKLIVRLLAPHLYDVYRDSRRRQEGIPRLTPREWQVLELAAQGNGNAEIARRLVTSVGTVRKHMEHILEHTGTHSRSAAVATMMAWSTANVGALGPFDDAPERSLR